MSLVLPSPFGGQAVPLVGLLAALTWLFFLWGGRRPRWRRAAVVVYLITLGLAAATCLVWLAGGRR